jgi:hypothetical protein
MAQDVIKKQFSQLLTAKEVSLITRRSLSTLARDRYKGIGLPYIKYNTKIYYRIEDVQAYIDQNITVNDIELAN